MSSALCVVVSRPNTEQGGDIAEWDIMGTCSTNSRAASVRMSMRFPRYPAWWGVNYSTGDSNRS